MADIAKTPEAVAHKESGAAAISDKVQQEFAPPKPNVAADTAGAKNAPSPESAVDPYKALSASGIKGFIDTDTRGILLVPPTGMDSQTAIKGAIDFAKGSNEGVRLEFQNVNNFGDISLPVTKDSTPEDLGKAYAAKDAELVSLQKAGKIPPGYFDHFPVDKGGTVLGGMNPDGSIVSVFDPKIGAVSYGDTDAINHTTPAAVIQRLVTRDGTTVKPMYDRAGNVGQLQIQPEDSEGYTLTRQGDPDGHDWVDSRNPGVVRHLQVEAKAGNKPKQTAEIGIQDLDNPSKSDFFGTNGKEKPEFVVGAKPQPTETASEADARKRAAQTPEVAKMQTEIDSLVSKLPDAIKGGDAALVDWVGKFANVNDNRNLVYDTQAISQKLIDAGFKFDPAVDTIKIDREHDLHGYAKAIIGAAQRDLSNGMPIHPRMEDYTDDFVKQSAKGLPQTTAENSNKPVAPEAPKAPEEAEPTMRMAGSMDEPSPIEKALNVPTERIVESLGSPDMIRSVARDITDPNLRDAMNKIADLDLSPREVTVARNALSGAVKVGSAIAIAGALIGLALYLRNSRPEEEKPPTFEVQPEKN